MALLREANPPRHDSAVLHLEVLIKSMKANICGILDMQKTYNGLGSLS